MQACYIGIKLDLKVMSNKSHKYNDDNKKGDIMEIWFFN